MKPLVYSLILWVLALVPALAQQEPFITSPSNGATNVALKPTINATSLSTGNSVGDEDFVYIEVSDNNLFDGSGRYEASDIFEKPDDAQLDFSFTLTANLQCNTLYYVRANSDKYGPGSTLTFTTTTAAVAAQGKAGTLQGVGSLAASTATLAATPFANSRVILLFPSPIPANADTVDWEFSISTTFTSPNIKFTSKSAVNLNSGRISFNVNDQGLTSGRVYYVRVRGRSSCSTGPWSTGANIRKFGNALFFTNLTAPTGTITRTGFKIWTNIVDSANRYFFQVDTNSNFSTPHTLSSQYAYLNESLSGVTGTVFRNNYSTGTVSGQVAFDFISRVKPGKTYYIRTRATRWTSGSTYRQLGYWDGATGLNVSSTRVSGFNNVTNNQTNFPTDYVFKFFDDNNFTETAWDMQVSHDNFATTDFNFTNITAKTKAIPNLRFNTTYQVRVRSYAQFDASPSSWATYTITTVASPDVTIILPVDGTTYNKRGFYHYASYVGSIVDGYDWQLERTDTVGSSFSISTSTRGKQFNTFLKPGHTYRIRVRATISTQSIVGVWSPWVNYTISASSPLPAPLQRIGLDESANILYPNPTTGSFTLQLGEAGKVQLLGIDGRLISQNQLNEGSHSLTLTGQPSGIYSVRIISLKGKAHSIRLRKE